MRTLYRHKKANNSYSNDFITLQNGIFAKSATMNTPANRNFKMSPHNVGLYDHFDKHQIVQTG